MRRVLQALLRTVFGVLFRVRVQGDMTRFDAPRLLIVANHESFLDGLILGLYLPVDPVFVVHTGVARNRWFRLVLSLVDSLAVDPTSPMAMKTVVRLVDTGRPVVIFPEGRITVTGSLMKVYDGPAFVAAKTGATLVPVRLDGPARTWFSRVSGKYPKRLFPQITMSIQPPTRIEVPAEGSAKVRRRKAGEAMRRVMQQMLFSSQPKVSLYSTMLDAMQIFGRGHRVVEDVKQIEYSYGDLLKMTLALGRLASREVAAGERAGILLPNLATTLGLLVGMGAMRRVPAMLNFTAGTDGMQNACLAAGIRTVFTSRQFLEQARLEQTVAALRDIRVIHLEDLRAGFGLGDRLWLLAMLAFPRLVGRDVDPEEAAVVLFTSGSEGKPKGVVLSHRALLSNIAQVRSVIDIAPNDKVLNALPMFHSFGLTGGALLPLATGTGVFLYPSPLHYRVIPEVIYDRGCSVLFGTSTFLGNYGKHAHPYDFYRLRYVVAGAEKLSDTVRDTWVEKFGIRILEGYGATETAPVIAVNTPMAFRRGTVGQLLPSMQGLLVPVPGIERGGMLHVSGPNLMSGYLRVEKPGVLEPPKSALGEGWYETGDICDIDADGFVTILGRVKRFAKIAGEMVSLEVVEKLALAASAEGQHAATAIPDPQRGETIVLFSTDTALTRDRLQQAARSGGLPEITVPRIVVIVDALPLLGTGKIDYTTLRTRALAGTGAGTGASPA
ncbi:MAG: bifunctional acyl-ACP--phospholipid O-acyltransferase/long-chain-fatty-acid--ACP ligase [bacterium]|jgi:acyl-[acyl-carrier-protein]-phospholipid O-acyltransferase/long-chain-fatty-acid--[acyl-carrier-protein] ligase|nr:bifunctional acyl-ACP--phospholipid O-acyltransferase/long-chain-fatty-acid--ACP ligase [Betaproteobacteria bacterium]